MAKQPDYDVKVRRRSKTGGANVFINADVLCKALKNSAIPCDIQNLVVRASAMKDGKRAKIVLHIYCK